MTKEVVINPNDFENPITEIKKYDYYRVDPGLRKSMRHTMKTSVFDSDDGWLLSDPKTRGQVASIDWKEADISTFTS